MKLKIKRMRDGALMPKRATAESAGLDLSAFLDQDTVINPGEIVKIPTGIAIGLEVGTVGLVYPRSGLSSKYGITLANCVGVIDSDYRGEIIVGLINQLDTPFIVQPGDRIAQLIIMPVMTPDIEEVEELTPTRRGTGGFGSTGK